MPLSARDRRFLQTVDRLKAYLLLLACAIFLYLVLAPTGEMQMATSIMGLALCAVFWLTQRLLAFITVLDFELTRVANTLKRIAPNEARERPRAS